MWNFQTDDQKQQAFQRVINSHTYAIQKDQLMEPTKIKRLQLKFDYFSQQILLQSISIIIEKIPKIQQLYIDSKNRVGSIMAICLLPILINLQSLKLSFFNSIKAEVIEVTSKLKNLIELNFQNNSLKGTQINRLLRSLDKLVTLNLSNNNLNEIQLQGIRQKVVSLKFLNLNNNKIREQGIINISLLLPQLQAIQVDCCQILDQGLLIIGIFCKNIEGLSIRNNRITSEGVESLVKRQKNIKYLNISNNNIGRRGGYLIVQSQKNLVCFDAQNCNITGNEMYMCLPKLGNLTNLNVKRNKPNDIGMLRINRKSKYWVLEIDSMMLSKRAKRIIYNLNGIKNQSLHNQTTSQQQSDEITELSQSFGSVSELQQSDIV